MKMVHWQQKGTDLWYNKISQNPNHTEGECLIL